MKTTIRVIILSIICSSILLAAQAESSSITLDEATKQVIETTKSTVLTAETKLINHQKIHIIKILTEKGRVQHIKLVAETGKIIDPAIADDSEDD
jgi:uncharacterized membrane protein YkoI